jgi:DNA helicase-4
MQIKPFALLNIFVRKSLSLIDDPPALFIFKNGKNKTSIKYDDIYDIKYGSSFIFSKIVVILNNRPSIKLSFIPKISIDNFLHSLSLKLKALCLLKLNDLGIEALRSDYKDLMSQDRYVAYSDISLLKEKYGSLVEYCSCLVKSSMYELFDDAGLSQKIKNIEEFRFTEEIEKRNAKYLESEKNKYKNLFVNAKGNELTEEQKNAIITLEDRNLLIAAAGSGKTETMLYKLKYFLKKGSYEPKQILLLAFNKKVRKELIKRTGVIGIDLGKGNIHTFHSFGLSVINKSKDHTVSVADENFANRFIRSYASVNKKFFGYYVEFVTRYLSDLKETADPYAEYNDLLERDRYKKAVTGKDIRYRTIKGEYVKSYQEAVIANYLYVNGVNYQYEKPYFSKNKRQIVANPDFYYPDADLYHEHFAVDNSGKSVFGEEYIENMERKIKLYKKDKVDFIATTSGMFFSGKLLGYLKKELIKRGLKLNPKSVLEINRDLSRIGENKLNELLASFLDNFKDRQISLDELKRKAKSIKFSYGRKRNILFLKMFEEVYSAYANELKSKNMIDYTDMVIKAAESINSGDFTPDYKLIMIDEFQDISDSKFNMVKAVLDKNKDAKLFAVGDDYQAINGFSGSNIKYIYDFGKYFKNGDYGVKTDFLTKTFRCDKGIVDYSSEFIQKNPKQIKKSIVANTNLAKDAVVIVNYEEDSEIFSDIEELLKNEKDKTVFILNRKNKSFLKNDLYAAEIDLLKKKFKPQNITIFNDTIHGAKGLEADIVFLIYANKKNIPSENASDSILNLVSDTINEYPFAEERRLYYVALTRAREKVVIYANKSYESPFLKE